MVPALLNGMEAAWLDSTTVGLHSAAEMLGIIVELWSLPACKVGPWASTIRLQV